MIDERFRHLVAVDIVTVALRDDALHVLLIERGVEPFAGRLALPGGFVGPDESVEAAAARELQEETGLAAPALHALPVFSAPGRDPRGRVISVPFLAALPADRAGEVPVAGSDAAGARWAPLDVSRSGPRRLAFDHDDIVACAVAEARAGRTGPQWPLGLLPREFTLREAQRVFELLLGRPLDKVTFRRRMRALGALRETARWREGAHRPARLYAVGPAGPTGLAGGVARPPRG